MKIQKQILWISKVVFVLLLHYFFTTTFLFTQVLQKNSSTTNPIVVKDQKNINTFTKPFFSNSGDSISYAFGLVQAMSYKNQGFLSFNEQLYFKGFVDGYDSNFTIPLEVAKQIVANVYRERQRQLNEQAKKSNEFFLVQNKQKEGVGILPSGVQYEIIKNTNGVKPTINNQVTVNYKGYLINGQVFDSSILNNPRSFPLKNVIKGWQEVIPLMSVGSKWKIFVPHTLAYGSQGVQNLIPPFATLIFEIELLDFK